MNNYFIPLTEPTDRPETVGAVRQGQVEIYIVDPDSGDTDFSVGDKVELVELIEENERIVKIGGKEAKGDTDLLGITQVSITSKSFLSAASFQNTNKVLIDNAVRGGIDHLRGLKENVIVGRLIPAGTGFGKGGRDKEEIIEQ